MGWNQVFSVKESKLYEGIKDGENFYFANSYYIPGSDYTTGKTIYGVETAASIEKSNFYGVQFHPEKSGPAGIKLLKNFIELC